MTVFTMRCFTKLRKGWLALMALLWLCSFPAHAGDIDVLRTEAYFSDGNYELSASYDVHLTFAVQQALEQGVPLYFVAEFTLMHPRWYWLDEEIAHSEQTVRLSYNILTRQYRITRGALYQTFSTLGEALRIISHQSADPIPASLLQGNGWFSDKFRRDGNYVAAVRLHLDVTQLPKPLQVNALTGTDWNIDSGWYRWIVRTDAAAQSQGE